MQRRSKRKRSNIRFFDIRDEGLLTVCYPRTIPAPFLLDLTCQSCPVDLTSTSRRKKLRLFVSVSRKATRSHGDVGPSSTSPSRLYALTSPPHASPTAALHQRALSGAQRQQRVLAAEALTTLMPRHTSPQHPHLRLLRRLHPSPFTSPHLTTLASLLSQTLAIWTLPSRKNK
jgi:hypothetical protein